MRYAGHITIEIDCEAENEDEAIEKGLKDGYVIAQHLYTYQDDNSDEQYEKYRDRKEFGV